MNAHALYCGGVLVLSSLLLPFSMASGADKPAGLDTFVRVSARNSRYFELTDGTPYIPIGFNLVDAPPEKDWPEVLATMAAHKINYCRIFLDAPPWRIEQRTSGQYDADNTEVLVRFLKAAGRQGIRVKVCLEHFRDVQPQPANAPPPKDHWSQRPYHHRDNGGPFASMEEYLNSETGIAQWRRKLAFYRAHCDDRPEIFAWELWNEMDCVKGDWLTWTKRMLPEVHRLFPKNMVAQSLGSFDTPKKRDAVYRPTVTLAGNDVAQVHRYLDPGASWEICHGPIDVMLADAVAELRAMTPDRPILVAETGAVKPKHTGCSELYEKDKAGMILHDVIFAPFFAGAAGPGHAWWWRQSIQQPNLWQHFDRFAAAIEGTDIPAERFEPTTIAHPRLRIYVLKGRTTLLAWCRDSRNDWRSELEAGNAPEVLKGQVLDLAGQLPKDVPGIRIYDPWKDRWSDAKIASGKIALPAFERSIVVRVCYPRDMHVTAVPAPHGASSQPDLHATTTAAGPQSQSGGDSTVLVDCARPGPTDLVKKFDMCQTGYSPPEAWVAAAAGRIRPIGCRQVRIVGALLHSRFGGTPLSEPVLRLLKQEGAAPYVCMDPNIIDGPNDLARMPSNMARWRQVLRKAAEQARAYGGVWFEVWNEPNGRDFWKQGRPEMFELYRVMVEEVRAVHPDSRFVGPGITSAGIPKWLPPFLDYVEKNQLPLDAIAFHDFGRDYTLGERWIVPNLKDCLAELDKRPYFRDKNIEIHIGECSFFPDPRDGDPADRAEAAAHLPQLLRVLLAEPRLTLVQWAQLFDTGHAGHWGNLGVIDAETRKAKPLYNVLLMYAMMPIRSAYYEQTGPVHCLASANDHTVAVLLDNATNTSSACRLEIRSLPFAAGTEVHSYLFAVDKDHSSFHEKEGTGRLELTRQSVLSPQEAGARRGSVLLDETVPGPGVRLLLLSSQPMQFDPEVVQAADSDEAPGQRQTARPEISTAPLLNPGKGWVLYDMPEAHRGGSRPYGSIGYTRFNWCDIEPQEGRYNWKPIDEFMAAWKREGLPVAFGVMTANIHYKGMYVTPKWVFDAGCKPRTVQQKRPETAKDVAAFYQYEGPQVIPADWLDPVYLAKLEAFLTAVAKRYDGRPELAWYEIRAYGNWGEGHLWPWRGDEPTPEQLFEHYIQLHRRLFPKSLLMANETYFRSKELHQRAARIGVGVRDDGVMSFRNGGTTAECDGLAPSCFEWGCSYEQAIREGLLTKKGWSLEDCIRNGHVYYCGFARSGIEDIKAFAQNEQPLIDRLTNLMGYHLVIDEASLPKSIVPGHEFALAITWRNAGVARMWFACSVAVALLDNKDQVVARTWLEDSRPGTCPGGGHQTEQLTARLADVPAGDYRLAIGLFRDRQAERPEVKLGLKDITPDNWHPLAKVHMDGSQQSKEQSRAQADTK